MLARTPGFFSSKSMALICCTHCAHMHSGLRAVCPRCGRQNSALAEPRNREALHSIDSSSGHWSLMLPSAFGNAWRVSSTKIRWQHSRREALELLEGSSSDISLASRAVADKSKAAEALACKAVFSTSSGLTATSDALISELPDPLSF